MSFYSIGRGDFVPDSSGLLSLPDLSPNSEGSTRCEPLVLRVGPNGTQAQVEIVVNMNFDYTFVFFLGADPEINLYF